MSDLAVFRKDVELLADAYCWVAAPGWWREASLEPRGAAGRNAGPRGEAP